MAAVITTKKTNVVDTFEIKGEKFVILKKEYLDELITLMKSFIVGEKILIEGKTRSFSNFLKSVSKNKKK